MNGNASWTKYVVGFSATEHSGDSLKSMSISSGQNLEKELAILPVTSPAKCAEDIIKATARREAEVYYPYNQVLWVARIFSILISDFGRYEGAMHGVFHVIIDIKNCLFAWF